MKLDRFKFAMLAAWIGNRCEEKLTQQDIGELDFMTEMEVEPVSTGKASEADVNELLRQIGNEDGFIPAIKAYRSLTGAGLKESKEEIEKYRNITVSNHKASTPFNC